MHNLEAALRTYPWGSRTLLAQLRGTTSPAPTPEAELWFGAHPAAPSSINGEPLDKVISADPSAALGQRVEKAFDGQLPFLVKLLAAGEPLSIQAHPSRDQAAAGFARENALGLALDDPRRNYKDANPKPEIIVALTPFRALAGFRPVSQTRELFEALSGPGGGLDRYSAMLVDAEPTESVRAVFTTLISLPGPLRKSLLADVIAAAEHIGDAPEWIRDAAETFLALAKRYPSDVGPLVALMLNLTTLHPGEALYLAAGQPHAYLSGLGVEVMANSDNVLRGGLTSKHVDVPELVRVLDFTPRGHLRVPVRESDGVVEYELPVSEFEVSKHTLAKGEELSLLIDGPAILLITSGHISSGDCVVGPGQGAWIPASEAPVSVIAQDDDGAEVFFVRA